MFGSASGFASVVGFAGVGFAGFASSASAANENTTLIQRTNTRVIVDMRATVAMSSANFNTTLEEADAP